MNRMPRGHFGGFLDHLGQRRMGVDGGFDFVPGGFEVHGEADFGKHLGAFAADDLGTDDFTVGLALRFNYLHLNHTASDHNEKLPKRFFQSLDNHGRIDMFVHVERLCADLASERAAFVSGGA